VAAGRLEAPQEVCRDHVPDVEASGGLEADVRARVGLAGKEVLELLDGDDFGGVVGDEADAGFQVQEKAPFGLGMEGSGAFQHCAPDGWGGRLQAFLWRAPFDLAGCKAWPRRSAA